LAKSESGINCAVDSGLHFAVGAIHIAIHNRFILLTAIFSHTLFSPQSLDRQDPLKMLLWFSIGPFSSQLASYGLVSTIWLSYLSSTDTQAVLFLVMTLDFVPDALGFFLCVSGSVLFADQDCKRQPKSLRT
jgi:hypothetical protein